MAFFFVDTISERGSTQVLSEETSRHVVQVLRMVSGDELRLTDGKGQVANAVIVNDHKKKCEVTIQDIVTEPRPASQHTIAISLLKNNTRLEWFLEKAAELGLSRIVPLICARTEKQHFRFERMNTILISAMLQSQQAWQTELLPPISFNEFVSRPRPENSASYIAHCEQGEKLSLLSPQAREASQKLVLIGPEGDFTPEEIALAVTKGFQPLELGKTRLRTETAGLIAATFIQLG